MEEIMEEKELRELTRGYLYAFHPLPPSLCLLLP